MKNHEQFVADEYLQGHRLDYVIIGEYAFVLPVSYNGDIQRFIHDLFPFRGYFDHDTNMRTNNLYKKLGINIKVESISTTTPKVITAFTAKYKLDKIRRNADPSSPQIEIPNFYIQPTKKQVLDHVPQEEIAKRALRTARRYYLSAIKKTVRARKEVPDKEFDITLDLERLAEINKQHKEYIKQRILEGLKKTFKWSSSQILEISSGATGALPAAVYYLLNKRLRFADNKTKRFVDEKVLPYIRKGALKALIPLSLFATIKITPNIQSNNKETQKIEIKTTTTKETQVYNQDSNRDVFTKKYRITDKKSFDMLYQKAFPFIALSMMPTEILVCNPYADNGGKISNTVGLGSYWLPKDGNFKSSKWIKTSQYIKKHSTLCVTGKQACDLADGWFRYRENGRVYDRMFELLQGAELNICEFAAIATCVYNNEQNGFDLCHFVNKNENYKDPIKCAKYLLRLKPGNLAFDDGILKRHIHEALIYLNVNNYANKIPYFMVKRGVNSKGNTYYVSSVTQLNPQECKRAAENFDKGNFEALANLSDKIYNYHCKGGQSLYEIISDHNIEHILSCYDQEFDFKEVDRTINANKLYAEALYHYNDKDYDKALKSFQNMIKQGFDGADIYNDIAITCYHLGKYQECIEACQHVLNTGEKEMYPAANYNAGKAYLELGNHQKASQNFQLASKRDPNNKTYEAAVKRFSPKGKSSAKTSSQRKNNR